MRKPFVLCLVALAWGCDHEVAPSGACPAMARAGLDVGVTSDQTAQAVCDAAVTATDGSHAEQLVPRSCRYAGAFERPGTYVVRAEKTGFLAGEVSDVRVIMETGQCPHVQAARLDIRISPAPAPAAAPEAPEAPETPPAPEKPAPMGPCAGTVAEYCARLGGPCPTYQESVERRRALCAQPPQWVVTTSECAGLYRSVNWRDQVLGGGDEYFSLDGRLIAAYLFTDYGEYCNGSFTETFGAIPTCATQPSTTNLCQLTRR